METRSKVLALAYNGVDGACAAAVVRVRFPKAELLTTSARRIGVTLAGLAEVGYSEIHVCGVGIYCPWDELNHALMLLKKAGTKVRWHCGRGYLDDQLTALQDSCEPTFLKVGTNTAAVARFFGLSDDARCRELTALARLDTHVQEEAGVSSPSREQSEWLDYIQAAMAQYFKFQDIRPYLNAIRALAVGKRDASANSLVDAFRQTGYRHLLYGQSDHMRRLKERIQLCADARRSVIITGESGVGKELVANLLYERGARGMGPLIAVNCSLYAGNTALANSDLFGHKKGAFTGATHDRKGKFVQADGGVLFLDELGELPLEVQAKLLRVVEDGRVTPEGADHHESEVDVLVIAATNRNINKMVAEGTFRADLYHRLATLRIHVPPLRERPEDIDFIVNLRLERLASEGQSRKLGSKEIELLRSFHWPGNVRQLLKLLDRAVLLNMSIEDALDEERNFGGDQDSDTGSNLALPETRDVILPMSEVQRRYARHVWELHNRNYTSAARSLAVSENTLRYNYLK